MEEHPLLKITLPKTCRQMTKCPSPSMSVFLLKSHKLEITDQHLNHHARSHIQFMRVWFSHFSGLGLKEHLAPF